MKKAGKDKNKRGQVAIYVIIALAILVLVLAVILYPKLKPKLTEDVAANPQAYLSSCLSPIIKEKLNDIASHGGDAEPEGFILYNNKKIKYLCYTNENYKTCVVQQPLIKEHIEEVLARSIKAEAQKCVELMADAIENQGYSVSSANTDAIVSIIPEKIQILINAPMTITKENSRTYKNFNFDIKSQYYDILYIATSIVDYEATYGDSLTENYIQYYPDISIDKTQLSDGTTIYKIANVITNEEFAFASRSVAWPPGYGLS